MNNSASKCMHIILFLRLTASNITEISLFQSLTASSYLLGPVLYHNTPEDVTTIPNSPKFPFGARAVSIMVQLSFLMPVVFFFFSYYSFSVPFQLSDP